MRQSVRRYERLYTRAEREQVPHLGLVLYQGGLVAVIRGKLTLRGRLCSNNALLNKPYRPPMSYMARSACQRRADEKVHRHRESGSATLALRAGSRVRPDRRRQPDADALPPPQTAVSAPAVR